LILIIVLHTIWLHNLRAKLCSLSSFVSFENKNDVHKIIDSHCYLFMRQGEINVNKFIVVIWYLVPPGISPGTPEKLFSPVSIFSVQPLDHYNDINIFWFLLIYQTMFRTRSHTRSQVTPSRTTSEIVTDGRTNGPMDGQTTPLTGS